MFIIKQPSPEVNPANQKGSLMTIFSTMGLSTGILLGKANFKFVGIPKLIEALRLRIF